MRAGWLVLGACVWACGPAEADPPPNRGGSGATPGVGAGGDGFGGDGAGGAGTGNTPVTSGGAPPGGGGSSPGGGPPGAGGAPIGPLPPFDAGTEPTRNQVVAGNVCDRLATIQCAGEAHCCNAPGRDVATCKATLAAQCRDDLFIDALSLDPLAGFSPSHAEAAFAAFEQRSSNCDPGVALWAAGSTGLRGIVQGTRANGADCTPAGNELLQTVKVAGHLASCADPANNACLPAGGLILQPWRCVQRSGPGATCFTDVNCTDGNYCPNPKLDLPSGNKPQCLARKAAGQPCEGPNECLSLTCRNSVCVDATTQTAYCLAQP